ncbi:hypothetical protein J1N35_034294, partial [Gossypium stocksii]
MPSFLDFRKELQAVVAKEVGEAQPAKTDLATTEKETEEPKEETKKMESFMDSTTTVPPPFTEPITKHDHEINWFINESQNMMMNKRTFHSNHSKGKCITNTVH